MKTVWMMVLAALMTTSCTTLKRYGSAEPSATDNTLADIDLFGFRLGDAMQTGNAKSLWDLSADAQSQYLRILNTRYPANEEFIKAMNFRYIDQAGTLSSEEFLKKELRMIFSVTKQRKYGRALQPGGPLLTSADRIEYLRITLSLPDNAGIRFTGWNRFATEYGSIDIAGVSFSRNLTADISGNVPGGKKGGVEGVSAEGQASVSQKEEQQLRYRYLMLNGSIRSDRMVMEEEGTREIDLTGNIAADISLEFDGIPEIITSISALKDSAGRFNSPEKLIMMNSEVSIPEMDKVKDTVFADLRMDYVFRNVIKGEKTFQEWDDKVRYYTGTAFKTIVLMTAPDYLPVLFCTGRDKGNAGGEPIRITRPDGVSFPLVFRSEGEAGNFIAWLNDFACNPLNSDKAVILNGSSVTIDDRELTGRMINEDPRIRILPYYTSQP